MYPTGCVPPKFYELPKIHKLDTPRKPIVSSCGSVSHDVAKELAKILKPLVGKSPQYINSICVFVEQVKQLTLAPWVCLSSYNVSALFTPVPVLSRIYWKKTPSSRIEQYLQSRTSFNYWNFVSKTHTFHSKTSSMNKLKVWLWIPQSTPL